MALNGINANVLTLYKVSILGDENLAPILRSLFEENDQPSDELHSHCILSNIFSDGVKKEHLHIVVQIQMPGASCTLPDFLAVSHIFLGGWTFREILTSYS